MRILLVEDHPALREMVTGHLGQRGFAVDVAATVEEALGALAATTHDALVLDLGLPDGDGMSVLQAAQNHRSGAIPTLIVTARDALEDRIKGLDAGADDYIIKPFDLIELEARLRAVLRRPGSRTCTVLRCGALAFDTNNRQASVNGEPIELTRREADLLDSLLRAAGQVIIRDVLEERLYAFDNSVTPNALEATVSRLRKRLMGAGIRIETRRGIGYRLIGEPSDKTESEP
ncbi:transcriptional regulator [Skermanella stibiiresistens SB22]|uniref:Transcriptional regulator n=1 Tax=Skermanella stibiiresistens SB22 TaxID=1385369 RepID=W9GYA5_9PROT|nr:response regulator transcription factor [Skermanella stibiiresistens]EWY36463.1 transcriptional regulator [Skermanella stibiiresistens SB22]